MNTIAGGMRIVINQYAPTWGPPPTRRDIWKWRLWDRWFRRPRPKKERQFFYSADGTVVVSPENYVLLKTQLQEAGTDETTRATGAR